jgi:hypothetical protein
VVPPAQHLPLVPCPVEVLREAPRCPCRGASCVRRSLEITHASEPSQIDIDRVFEKPWKAHNSTVFAIRPSDEGSQVTWTMTGPKTLMTRVMGIFTSMDKLVGKDFEKGLARLKAVAERPAT